MSSVRTRVVLQGRKSTVSSASFFLSRGNIFSSMVRIWTGNSLESFHFRQFREHTRAMTVPVRTKCRVRSYQTDIGVSGVSFSGNSTTRPRFWPLAYAQSVPQSQSHASQYYVNYAHLLNSGAWTRTSPWDKQATDADFNNHAFEYKWDRFSNCSFEISTVTFRSVSTSVSIPQ